MPLLYFDLKAELTLQSYSLVFSAQRGSRLLIFI